MTNESDALSEREEIEALLPWYATGKLDAASRARVTAYMDRHPDMRRQLALVEEDRAATLRANDAVVPSRTLTADRLIERVRGSRPAAAARPVWTVALDAIRDVLSAPTETGVRWAAVAAVAILLAQTAVIGGLMSERPRGGYETASGGAQLPTDGVRVLVRFQADARIEAIAAALVSLGMRIVDGPKPGGLFVVRVAGPDVTDAVKAERIAKLRDLSTIVAVVLPMGP